MRWINHVTSNPKTVIIAPFLLGVGFLGHLFNVLVIEPGLGFESPQDFYDADRLLPVIGHWVWPLGATYHLCVAAGVLMLALTVQAAHPAASYAKAFGVAAAVLFILVAISNIVGMRELYAVAAVTEGDKQAMHGAFLIVRTMLLSAAALLLGLFLLVGNSARILVASAVGATRYVGAIAGILFAIMPALPQAAPAALLSVIVWGILAGAAALRRGAQ